MLAFINFFTLLNLKENCDSDKLIVTLTGILAKV